MESHLTAHETSTMSSCTVALYCGTVVPLYDVTVTRAWPYCSKKQNCTARACYTVRLDETCTACPPLLVEFAGSQKVREKFAKTGTENGQSRIEQLPFTYPVPDLAPVGHFKRSCYALTPFPFFRFWDVWLSSGQPSVLGLRLSWF